MDHPDDSLKVPFDYLDDWTKRQDITVYKALMSVVKNNPEIYKVQQVEGAMIPNYAELENELLGSRKQ